MTGQESVHILISLGQGSGGIGGLIALRGWCISDSFTVAFSLGY